MHRQIATILAGVSARDSCVFSGSDGAASASASKADCATITLSALTVPSGTTLDLTDLSDGTSVVFEGTTTWEYAEWDGPLFAVSGSSITVSGADGHELDGQGALWWDGEGDDGISKPKFFQAHDLTDSTIENINIVNPPHQVFSINGCQTLTVSGVTIDASDGDADDLGANTDCFDIGSSDSVTITGATCYNQDDCVAVNSGTNIIFSGGYCSGGHGLSIGSVGGRDDNTVDTVTFSDSQVIDSQQAVRIKTISGDTGTVNAITYKDITISGATDYGVIITQAYDGDEATTGVPITGLVLDGVTGTVSSDADAAIFIDCGDGSCSDWTWSGVDLTGADNDCTNQWIKKLTLCE
ncbi:family 28 glycoside hydrolase [Cryphonectria parasitica EP155]|uniref:endo-polygalacturonase n=1 Tax=Cryphonectria parasitica (strain ATCC 38755 / EP155) TaxID=660469 RepID=A0A9P5CPQ1_CRYP1|nr:family 28 glycoside hydrolase [Cryphonectria parasitica EP155]KAF3766714.1 family 28 glycoside hydrolase [Cryphonectria parasitica EP155]